MIFSQNLISILLSKPDKQADMQMSFLGADPLPKTPDHQKKFVAHQNSDFFILSYALMLSLMVSQQMLSICCVLCALCSRNHQYDVHYVNLACS